jgi:hypothetical protein
MKPALSASSTTNHSFLPAAQTQYLQQTITPQFIIGVVAGASKLRWDRGWGEELWSP